jgi:hypothetical protein
VAIGGIGPAVNKGIEVATKDRSGDSIAFKPANGGIMFTQRRSPMSKACIARPQGLRAFALFADWGALDDMALREDDARLARKIPVATMEARDRCITLSSLEFPRYTDGEGLCSCPC